MPGSATHEDAPGQENTLALSTKEQLWETPPDEDKAIGRLIGNRFKVISRIGAGAFGTIYSGCDLVTNAAVAIKIEPKTIKVRQLSFEAHVYRDLQGIAIMPRLHAFIEENENESSLIMELLGPSLEELFNRSNRIQRIESLHSRYYLHRDIKPDNFVVGHDQTTINNQTTVYLIDYGLAKVYRRPGAAHIPFRDGKHLTGTARYASLNAHRGYEQSRRDDLESLGYVLIYFLRGSLPWQGLGRPKKPTGVKGQPEALNAKYARIAECKQKTSPAELTAGLPPEFAAYFTHVRGLRFEERPDYDYLRKLFKAVARRECSPITTPPMHSEDSGRPLKVLGSTTSMLTIPSSSQMANTKEYIPSELPPSSSHNHHPQNQKTAYHPRLGLSNSLPIRFSSSIPKVLKDKGGSNATRHKE